MSSINKKNRYFKVMMICSGILATTPVSILFYQAYGITFSQIMVIKTSTFVSTIIFELPSGFMGDKSGYKKVVQSGLICLIIACFGNVLISSFTMFVIWGIIWGTGMAMLSGADEAWYYKFLKNNGRESQYGDNICEVLSSVQFVSAVALIISSAIFVIDKRLPYKLRCSNEVNK